MDVPCLGHLGQQPHWGFHIQSRRVVLIGRYGLVPPGMLPGYTCLSQAAAALQLFMYS